MVKITGSNYIGGQPANNGNSTYHSINPKTQKSSDISFFNATNQEIKKSVKGALDAFQKLQLYTRTDVASFLRNISVQIQILEDQLIQICSWETALTENRLINERNRTCNQIEMFASYIEKGDYVEAVIDKKEGNDKPDIRRMLIPLGPVLVFPASNFPFAFGVCGGDTISAFAAGCPVVVKAHPSHPQTSELFAHAINQAIKKTGFPKEMFSLIHETKSEMIKEMIMQPEFEAIGFTGSYHAGRMIYDLASSRRKPIPVFAEMGSINPVFITKKAIQKRAESLALMLVDSITLGVGQFCTKPGILFIPETANAFVSTIADNIKDKNMGVLLNKSISKNYIDCIQKTLKTKQVKLLAEDTEKLDEGIYDNTLFITNLATYKREKELQVEHFGPTAIIVTYKKLKDLIDLMPYLEGQLTGTIHFENSEISEIKPFIELLKHKVGRLIINGVPTGVEVCYAMQHGGPYPATTAVYSTSVGIYAIKRFLRPVAFQDMPNELLPTALQNKNQGNIMRVVNQEYTRKDVI